MPNYQIVPVFHNHIDETHTSVKVEIDSVEHNFDLEVVESYLIGRNTPVWTAEVSGNEILEQYKPVEGVNIRLLMLK